MSLHEPMEVEEYSGPKTRAMTKRENIIDAIRTNNRAKLYECILDKHFDLIGVEPADKFKLFAGFMEDGYIYFLKKLYQSKGADLVSTLVNYGDPDEYTKRSRILDAIWNLSIANIDNLDMIMDFLKMGLPVDQQVGENGPTLLLRAIINERDDVVRSLLFLGADVNKRTPSFTTPLFLASKSHDSTIAKTLIQAGANIHDGNEFKQNPIHVACSEGSFRNLHLLLYYGANINDIDKNGYIPFCYIQQESAHSLCMQIMVEHIAILVMQKAHVHETNFQIIENNPRFEVYYKQCLSELQIMKETTIFEDITFFTVLTTCSKKLELYMKNKTFVKSFKMILKRRHMPIYGLQMVARFKNAEKKHTVKNSILKKLNKILNGAMPNLVTEKITSYLCYYQFKWLDEELQTDILNQKVLTWPLTYVKM